MVNDQKIEYLLTIARLGNVTQAAKQLYISQPALSQMISNLEKEIGAEIFNRNFSPLKLTYAGEKYLEFCIKVRDLQEGLVKEIGDINLQKKGKIIIGMSTHISISLSHLVIPTFLELYPFYNIELVEGGVKELEHMVQQGQIDVALLYHRDNPYLEYEAVIKDDIFFVAPPNYYNSLNGFNYGVSTKSLHIKDIKDYPFILLKKNRGMRDIAESIFKKFQVFPKIIIETDSIEVAHRLAKQNLGFTLVPTLTLTHRESALNGVYYPVEDFVSNRIIYLCYKKKSYLSLAAKNLIEIIKSVSVIKDVT